MTPYSVYNTKYFYRGRQIDEDFEPPYNFTEEFINHMTNGLVHPGWSEANDDFESHSCSSNCSIESCIIFGQPYTSSVLEAVSW